MKIETGMKCKQIKVLGGIDYVGKEFEITGINNGTVIVKCWSERVGFGIEMERFEEYFELIKEEIKEEIKQAINNELQNFKIGDIIQIKNKYGIENDHAGGCYSNYSNFFDENNLVQFKNKYIDNKKIYDGIYKIVGIGKHRLRKFKGEDIIIYVVEKDNQIYLMSNDYNEMNLVKSYNKNKTLELKDIKIGEKYQVVKNRNSFFGICGDIIDIEGQEVEVYDIDGTSIYIKDIENKTHTCRVENLEIIIEEKEKTNQIYTYEASPYKVHWKITHNGQTVYQDTVVDGLYVKVIVNGNTTIVILDDGTKGIAKCMPGDQYDMDKGVEIAYKKALIKSYQKELKKLVK